MFVTDKPFQPDIIFRGESKEPALEGSAFWCSTLVSSQILDKAGKAWKGQVLKLLSSVTKKIFFYNIGNRKLKTKNSFFVSIVVLPDDAKCRLNDANVENVENVDELSTKISPPRRKRVSVKLLQGRMLYKHFMGVTYGRNDKTINCIIDIALMTGTALTSIE